MSDVVLCILSIDKGVFHFLLVVEAVFFDNRTLILPKTATDNYTIKVSYLIALYL